MVYRDHWSSKSSSTLLSSILEAVVRSGRIREATSLFSLSTPSKSWIIPIKSIISILTLTDFLNSFCENSFCEYTELGSNFKSAHHCSIGWRHRSSAAGWAPQGCSAVLARATTRGLKLPPFWPCYVITLFNIAWLFDTIFCHFWFNIWHLTPTTVSSICNSLIRINND